MVRLELDHVAAVFVGLAALTRSTGMPSPFGGEPIDLWGGLVRDSPVLGGFREVLTVNLVLWGVVFTTAHLAMYVEPGRSFFKPYKFNSRFVFHGSGCGVVKYNEKYLLAYCAVRHS